MRLSALMLGVVLCAALSAYPARAGIPEWQKELADIVRQARADVFSQLSSGRGSATVYCEHMTAETGQNGITSAPKRTEFVYRGADYLAKSFPLEDEGRLMEARLSKNGRCAHYYAGYGAPPRSLHIAKERGNNRILGYRLEKWSFQEIGRIPTFPFAEQMFWAGIVEEPHVHIEKEGTVVRLTWRQRLPAAVIQKLAEQGRAVELDQLSVEFNMKYGGMITQWSHRKRTRRNGRLRDATQRGKISWHESNGKIIPVKRVVEVVRLSGEGQDQRRSKSACTIEFSRFLPGDVSPEELSLEAIGIPTGTPVVDTILGTDYRYGAAGRFGDPAATLSENVLELEDAVVTTAPFVGPEAPVGGEAGVSPPVGSESDAIAKVRPQPGWADRIDVYVMAGIAAVVVGGITFWLVRNRIGRQNGQP